ncbi:glycosyltransferase family 2 protein [Prochlorococcus sp. AH-736-N03]|nr:glycosyltransferase family 2 protein [Prochlorococcus sp. AH-736-N03]
MCKPLISFVIPVGDFNEYLNDAIESIIDLLDYNIKIEILIIFDKVLKKVESKFFELDFVKCHFNNSNFKGPGISRNIGIEKSNGTYLSFLDSDDLIIGEKFIKVLDKLIINKNDLIEFDYESFGTKTTFHNRKNELKYYNKDLPSKLLLRGELRDEVLFQIYKKSYLTKNNIKFPEGIYEDIFFRFMTLNNSKNISTSNLTAYKKRVHDKSITSNNKKKYYLEQYVWQISNIKNKFIHKKDIQSAIKYRMIAFAGLLAKDIMTSNIDKKDIMIFSKIFKDVCYKWELHYLKNKSINLTERESLIKKLLNQNIN